MHEVLVNRLGGLSLPRKSVVRLTDRPDMTLDVYRGRKTTIQQDNIFAYLLVGLSFRKKNLLISELRESTCKEKNNLTLRTDGWMDDRRFLVLFCSISVISGR